MHLQSECWAATENSPRWMSPRGNADLELQEQEERTCTVPECPCYLLGHCRALMLSCWRNHVLSLSAASESKQGGRWHLQKLKAENWEGCFLVPY